MQRPSPNLVPAAVPDACALLLKQLDPRLSAAANDLSELSFSPIEVAFRGLEWLDDGTLQDLRDQEGQHLAIRQALEGSLTGEVLWLLKEPDARRLVRILTGTPPGREPLSYTEREALTEVGNLLLLGLVEGLSDVLGMAVAATAPALRLGSAARLLPDEGSGGLAMSSEAKTGGKPLPGQLVLVLSSLSSVYFDRHLRILADREGASARGPH